MTAALATIYRDELLEFEYAWEPTGPHVPPTGYDINNTNVSPTGNWFRCDCSGYFWMCYHGERWGISGLGVPNSSAIADGWCHQIQWSELLPGDPIIAHPGGGDPSGHILMFVKWNVPGQSYFCTEFGGIDPWPNQRIVPVPYDPVTGNGRTFLPYRFKYVIEARTKPSPPKPKPPAPALSLLEEIMATPASRAAFAVEVRDKMMTTLGHRSAFDIHGKETTVSSTVHDIVFGGASTTSVRTAQTLNWIKNRLR